MTPRTRRRATGFTLLEVLVGLIVLLAISSVTLLSFRPQMAPTQDDPYVQIADARRAALASARDTTLVVTIAGAPANIHIAIDGSVSADSAALLDETTGRRLSDDGSR